MFDDYFDPDKAARQKSRRATDIDKPRKRNTVLGIVCLVMYVIVVNYVDFYQGLIMYQVKIFSSYSKLCVITFDEMLKRQAYDFESQILLGLSDDYYTDVVEVDSLP